MCITNEDGDLLVDGWTVQVFRYGHSPFVGSAPVDQSRGTARFDGVPRGKWTVQGEHRPSNARIEGTVTAAEGTTSDVVLVAHSIPTDKLLRVFAMQQQTLVRAFGMQSPLLTSATTGTVPLVGLGDHWWEFGPVGYDTHDLTIVDPRFVLRTINGLQRGLSNVFELEGSSGLRIVARAPDGEPLCPTGIALRGGEFRPWQVNAPLSDDATLTGLVASTYTVTVGFDHHTATVVEGVQLVTGIVTTLQVVGPPVVTLKGRAVDRDGVPLVGAAVRVSEVYSGERERALGVVSGLASICSRRAVTDENGEFSALRLRDGVFQVVVVPAGGGFTDWIDWLVELPAQGEHRVTIAPGAIGRVDVDVRGCDGARAFVVELVPAADFALQGAGLRQITASCGRASFERVPVGRYTVRARPIVADDGEPNVALECALDVQLLRSSLVQLGH